MAPGGLAKDPLAGLPVSPKTRGNALLAGADLRPLQADGRLTRVAPPRIAPPTNSSARVSSGTRSTAGLARPVASKLEQAILEETQAALKTLRAEVDKVASKQQTQEEASGNVVNQIAQVREQMEILNSNQLSAQRDQDLLCDVLQRQMAGLEDRLRFACEDLVCKSQEEADAGDPVVPKVSEKCEFFQLDMRAGKDKRSGSVSNLDRFQSYLEEMRSKESLLDKLQCSVSDLSRQQAQQLSIIAELKSQVEMHGYQMSRRGTDWSGQDAADACAAGIGLAGQAGPNQDHVEGILIECQGEAAAALAALEGEALTEATAKCLVGLVKVNFDMLCSWSVEVSLPMHDAGMSTLKAAFLLHVLDHCNLTLDELLAANKEDIQDFLQCPVDGLAEHAQEVFHAPSDTLEYLFAGVVAKMALVLPASPLGGAGLDLAF